MNVFQIINEDLKEVHLIMDKHFKIKAGNINDIMPFNFNYFDQNMRPAIVILSHKLFSPVTNKTLALAGVMQFIYLASRIHAKVLENNAGKDKPFENSFKYQFPVLIGDYLYGKFFTTLCDADIVIYLKRLAELMCIINKGCILGHKCTDTTDSQHYTESIRMESAEIIACCAYLGADLAGADKRKQQTLYDFGLNLGMAYGLLERGVSINQAGYYLRAADSVLELLPQSIESDCLENLINSLKDEYKLVQDKVG